MFEFLKPKESYKRDVTLIHPDGNVTITIEGTSQKNVNYIEGRILDVFKIKKDPLTTTDQMIKEIFGDIFKGL